MNKKNITLDIVIIGRNEEKFLESTLNSVIKAVKYFENNGYPSPKIIYVDGKSSDQSMKIAQKFKIKTLVVTGKPTPAKGRKMGSLLGKGKYIFFLDGDTLVSEGWLVKGVECLEKNSKIAGVGGILGWEQWLNQKITNKISNYWKTLYNGQIVIDGVGGNFLYRREILKQVGNFNPGLFRNEEFELRLRIAQAGYEIIRITTPMAIHRDDKTNSAKNFWKRHIFTKNIFIPGIITRQAKKNNLVIKLLFYKYWLYLLHPIIVLCILFSIFFSISASSIAWLISTIIFMIILFLCHYFYKGKNFRRTIISTITMNFFSIGWLIGLITGYPRIKNIHK